MIVNFIKCTKDVAKDVTLDTKMKDVLYSAAARNHATYIMIDYKDKNSGIRFSEDIPIPYELISDDLINYNSINKEKFDKWIDKKFQDKTIREYLCIEKDENIE